MPMAFASSLLVGSFLGAAPRSLTNDLDPAGAQ